MGWFAEGEVTKQGAEPEAAEGGGIKGANLHCVLIQKNWNSDGKDKVLDCGAFEIDSIDASGPPAKVNIKGTSIPYTSKIRTEKKTKGWENISLSGIAGEIAVKNGLKLMFECSEDPFYKRKEQVKISDIKFLQKRCKAEGISLKVTARMIVLFDAAEYEQKDAIRTIERGSADVLSWRFSTNFNDTAYSACRVSYTTPEGKTISATYKPKDDKKTGNGQTLEINEKVADEKEAKKLAQKRLREKNKKEYKADFTLVGDLDLVAGVTVTVIGWGMFDGKYIVETATHNITGGYTVSVQLRRVLEGY